ncbi:efflux RND transporter permease subunit [Halomonas vilamensis]|uniref:Efflux RND transporter permease subunit n=1 Tax=Vreelandella vilamensis TaxID=531309 RepID=A0ABU1H0M0_9GAMM|nr:efflux RND transporter permease subunit [Halomonas vilamensis]MDR5897862.1 efflux RND transporter permease subunit [Halomonas vilamensis]
MTLIDWSLKQPKALAAVVVLVAVWGILAYVRTPVDLFPDSAPPQVAVVTTQPGASATNMASDVTEILEKELNTLDGVVSITSTTRDGVSSVRVEFGYHKTLAQATAAVSNSLDRVIGDLPSNVKQPRIFPVSEATSPVMTLALRPKADSPKDLADVRLLAMNPIQDRLLALDGVGDVEVFGAHNPEVRVAIDREALAAQEMGIGQVLAAIQRANVTIPAGRVQYGQDEYLVTVAGEVNNPAELAQLPLRQSAQGTVRLDDVAEVFLGTSEARSAYHGNSKPAIALNILRPLEGTTLVAIDAVKAELPSLRRDYGDIEFEITASQEHLIEVNASGLRSSVLQAVILTIAVIFVFLADFRAAAVASVSIPLAFLGSLAVLGFTPYSLNMVTMSGLIIAVGLVIDSAVVVLENIIRRHRSGLDDNVREAARAGAKQVSTAVTAGILTTVVVVLPVMFAGGYLQQIMRPLNLMISVTLVGSLLAALTVIPVLAARLLDRPQDQRNRLEHALEHVGTATDRLGDAVGTLVQAALRQRWVTVVIALAFLVATVRIVPPLIGNELMPPMDTGIASINFETPAQFDLNRVESVLSEIEKEVESTTGVQRISSVVGSEPGRISFGSGGATAQTVAMTVYLVDRTQREKDIWQIMDGWRSTLDQLPGIKSYTVSEFGATPISTTKAPLDIIISGSDAAVLDALGEQVLAKLEGMPGVLDMRRSWLIDKPEQTVTVDRISAQRLGLSTGQVGQELAAAVNGLPAGSLRMEGFLDLPIRVAYANSDVDRPDGIGGVYLPSSEGPVPLRSVSDTSMQWSRPSITREDLKETLDITAVNRSYSVADVAAMASDRLAEINTPAGYAIKVGGTITNLNDNQQRMVSALLPGAAMLALLVFALFGSVRQTLAILTAVPLAVAGALWGLLVFNKPMSMPAIMGLILLSGTVVNNSILLLDFVRQIRAEGRSRDEAIVEAVRLRLRPVLMTTVSTVLGLSPLVFEMAVGLERMSPLGIAAATGLLIGTMLTLVVMPVLFSLLDDVAHALRSLGKKALQG